MRPRSEEVTDGIVIDYHKGRIVGAEVLDGLQAHERSCRAEAVQFRVVDSGIARVVDSRSPDERSDIRVLSSLSPAGRFAHAGYLLYWPASSIMTTIILPIEIETPNKRFAPVNRCIYCGNDSDPLTDEHIVPLALAGDAAVLPQASCLVCAEITGKFEGNCTRGMLGNFRIAVGSPTRRPKERPKTVDVKTGRINRAQGIVENVQKITLDRGKYPLMYPALTFPRAGLLAGRDRDAEIDYQASIHRLGDQIEEFAKKHGGAFEIDSTFYPVDFVRMVAKIAHSFCVATYGYGSFRPFLTDLILGRYNHLAHNLHWIGCEEIIPKPRAELFSIRSDPFEMDSGACWLVTWLQLFPFFSTPAYHIVVGDWLGQQQA